MDFYEIAYLVGDIAVIVFIGMGIKGSIQNVKEIIRTSKEKKMLK